MEDTTRRDFLKVSSAAVAGSAVVALPVAAAQADPDAVIFELESEIRTAGAIEDEALEHVHALERQIEIDCGGRLANAKTVQERQRLNALYKAHPDAAAAKAADKAWDAVNDRRHALERKLRETPASTPRGLLVKMRNFRSDYLWDDDAPDVWVQKPVDSMLADLERMTGKARS